MRRPSIVATVLVVVVLAVSFLAVDVDANALRDPFKCGKAKCHDGGKFKYSTFITYQYKYSANVNTYFAGSSDNRSVLNIEADVLLDFVTSCEATIKLTNVTARDQDDSYALEREEEFGKKLSANTLRFAFHNGVITEICSQVDEEDWVINFKRGVLSLFQNSMTRFDIDFYGIEQDIHGTCNTKYQMQGQQNTSLIVSKSKDLTKCMDRYKYLSILQTEQYNYQSKYQKWSVLQSENHCQITIDHHIYTAVSCHEKHLFDPFSGKNAGAMTTVIQDLKIVQETNKTTDEYFEEKSEETEKIKYRYNLFHNHIPTTRDYSKELRSARDVLKEICRVEEIRSNTDPNDKAEDDEEIASGTIVALWGNLVRACRGLHHSALYQLFIKAETICSHGKKYILDALPYVGSAGSVHMIKNLTINKAIDENTQKWLLSTAMIPRPDKEMIESMGELLKLFPLDKTISLATSSLIHSYCKNKKSSLEECSEEKQNMDVIKIFQFNVLNAYKDSFHNLSRDDRDKVTVSIKSLGNIGGFTEDFKNFLMNLIEEESVDVSIRVHTVDAFRRAPCSESRGFFLELFRKKSLDVEIRIASYLQVMRCPHYSTILEIFRILKEETVNQVSSFVWSHLENLETSTIPSRVEKQGLLSSNHIPKFRQKPDVRKFSRNYEQGIFFDKYNAGGNYEANVIMTPDSYIPRSVSLNLTIDMFGESINILELQARGEGFEKYIESLFSSQGPLNNFDLEEKLKKLRFTRATSDVKELSKKIDDINFNQKAFQHRFPILDLGVKIFGNEISYWSAEGDYEIQEAMRQLNPLHHVKKVLAGKHISYKKAAMFLDTTYSIPTGCGLPLVLNMMGTSITNVKMSGSISDTENVFETKTLSFEGKMHPSMAISVAATMSVNAGNFVDTGIRVNFQIHTATALSTNFQLKSGKLASLMVSIPHAKQEIFEAKSELMILHGKKEVKQRGLTQNNIKQSTCSWPIVEKAVGIQICANYEFPNMTKIEDAPYFILGGPIWYLLSLEKTDPTAKVYSFLYSFESNKTAGVFGFSFDTPGSKTKRMFNTSVNYSENYVKAIMNFHSAENHLRALATYKNQPDHMLLECKVDMDGQKHFDGVWSLTKQEQKNGYILIPQFYVAVNDEKITELAGTLRLTQKKGVSQCDVSIEFQTKRMASRLIGYLTWNGPSRGANLRLDYQFLGDEMETIRAIGLLSNRELGPKKDFYCELELSFTSYPHLNFYTNAKYMGNQNHIECSYNLAKSRDVHPDNMTLTLIHSRHRTINGHKLHNQIKVAKPYLDINHFYEEDGALSTFAITLSYDNIKHMGGKTGVWGRLYMPPDTKLYLEASLNATLPTFTPMVLNVHIFEKDREEYDITVESVWFTGVDATFAAVYQFMSTSTVTSRRLKAALTSSKFDEIHIESKYSKDNKRLNFNIEARQNLDKYGFIGRYILFSEYNISCYGQIDIKEKTYSTHVNANLLKDTHISADIHFDKVRDIHIVYSQIYTARMKKLNADVSWDVNRNPNRKISLGLLLENKGALAHSGSLVFLYPGRLISGEFDVVVKDWLCSWLIKLGWSPDDKVLWKVKVYTEMKNETIYALLSEMDTPFEGWKTTRFDLMWKYLDNLQILNGNLTLDKQKVSLDFLSNYLFKTNEAYGEISAYVNSTFKIFPTLSAVARHHHLWKKSSDTLLLFEYNNSGKIMGNSSWKYEKSQSIHNVLGKVSIISPFKGYKNGLLATKFTISDKRDINGLTHFHLEDNIYAITVDGHTKRFTNSIFNINVTSPSPQQSVMSCKLGIVDTDRHLVAMIKTPNFTTGVELIMMLTSVQNFHVHGHLAIPVQFLHNVMAKAKRNSEEIDFRLGFENFTLGFTGIWHYNTQTDFKYLYKVFTPLPGLEENGLVLKNIYDNGLDSEASIKLSKYKLGVALNIREHGKGVLRLIEDHYKKSDQTTNEPMKLTIEDFSTDVFMTLDTLFSDKLSLTGGINKRRSETNEELINLNSNVVFGNKTIFYLIDKMVLQDLLNFTNDLHITTSLKLEIKLLTTVDVIINENYNFASQLQILNDKKWSNNSLFVTYVHENEEEDEERHFAVVKMETQMEALRFLDAKMDLHTVYDSSKLNAYFVLPSCNIQLTGQVEFDEFYLDTKGMMNMSSPHFQPYRLEMEFKKDYTDIEKLIKAGIHVHSGNEYNYLTTEITHHGNATTPLKFKGQVSFIPVIPPTDFFLALSEDRARAMNILIMDARVGSKDMVYSCAAEYNNKYSKIAITSPHRGFKKINFHGTISEGGIVTGTYSGENVGYDIKGNVSGNNPIEVTAIMKPTGDTEIYTFHSLYKVEDDKSLSFTASLIGPIQFTLKSTYNEHNTANRVGKEIFIELFSPNNYIEDIFIKSKLDLVNNSIVSVNFQAATPLEKLKKINIQASSMVSSYKGFILYNYNTTYLVGDGQYKWSFYPDDLYIKALNQYHGNEKNNKADLDIYYISKSDIKTGVNVNYDDVWKIGGNASFLCFGINKTEAVVNFVFPQPNIDVHTFSMDLYTVPDTTDRSIEFKYITDQTKTLVSGKGTYISPTADCVDLNVTMKMASPSGTSIISGMVRGELINNNTANIISVLQTPIYKDEDTVCIKGVFENIDDFTIASGSLFYPASNQITDFDLKYGGWKHTVGKVNISTPLESLPWLATKVRLSNDDAFSENALELIWSDRTAAFNSTHRTVRSDGDGDSVSSSSGVFFAEIQLNTTHLLSGEYDLDKATSWSNGNGTVHYNRRKCLDGKFASRSAMMSDGVSHDTIDMNIDNEYTPIGVFYIHDHNEDGSVDKKQASVYHLKNSSYFNLTGNIEMKAWRSGKQIQVTVIQENRTWSLQNNFEAKDKELYQGSKIQWTPERWFQYNIQIEDKTQKEHESHELKVNMEYPEKSLGLNALYHLKDTFLDGEALIKWSLKGENKSFRVHGEWENEESPDINKHDLKILLAHPSFSKDVTFVGKYISDSETISNLSAVLEYSDYDNERLTFYSTLKDNSNGASRFYKLRVHCNHPATDLNLHVETDMDFKYNVFYLNNYYKYQKSLLEEKLRQAKVYLNFENHTMTLERTRDETWYLINSRLSLVYPEYGIFMTVNKTTGNDTGIIVLSTIDKSLIGHYNSTDDVSYHLIGQINDARSAQMNAWRDVDDIAITDLTSYIKLNHSKLLTSRITWSPEMITQIKNAFLSQFRELSTQSDEVLHLLKEVPMETHEALRNVWMDVKPRVKDLLTDLNDLHVVIEDLEDFQLYLNESYNENEFYLKDLVEFAFRIIDELSIGDHIKSLPAIVSELWHMMGNTGASLKDSIVRVIDTVKASYAQFVEQINAVLERDLMDQVSEIIESFIKKYDTFVKTMHLEFISYCNAMWKNTVINARIVWKNLMNSLEPTYIHVAHYAESYLFQFGTEVLDFFYARTEELSETPFFGLLAQFARDVDRFVKDIYNDDAITNFKKYSEKLTNFFNKKILVHIPFQKEIKGIWGEIFDDLNKLQDLGIVQSIKAKFWEVKSRLQWWYDYFNIGHGLSVVTRAVYTKIMEIPKTALQLEESNREPKTNFIFDPNRGLLLLEQKLPMPWHAFNTTPVFSEIPEYKFIQDAINTMMMSNVSLLSYYYQFKVYTDISNLFPPFEGHAVMTGHGTIITFDHQVYNLKDGGMFVLASDYWTRNFTVLVKSHTSGQYDLVLFAKKAFVTVDLFEQSVIIGDTSMQTLPVTIGDWNIERDEDNIIIENSEGVKIKCTFIFKTCTFDFKGEYFARLGGLFGTMNNEGYDDFMKPNGEIVKQDEFVQSWKIMDIKVEQHSSNNFNNSVCEYYFKNNVSPMKECFSLLSATPFYEICMEGQNPCTLANAYSESCFYNHIPTRIPSKCMECVTQNGIKIDEGDFGDIVNSHNSTDVVFIVESHQCNENIRSEKNVDILVETLESKLKKRGFTNNRYAVVQYGSYDMYKTAQSLYVQNRVFTDATDIVEFFDFIEIDTHKDNSTYSADAFEALSKASSLSFRPGVSKLFILYPCTKCDALPYKLDYSVVHQVLMDSSITLHILMDGDFNVKKRKRIQNILYGIDSKLAYTSKDVNNLVGDAGIHKLVSLPKSTIGFCIPLAAESNGTIFTARKMKSTKSKEERKVIGVFAERAAGASVSCSRTRCECHATKLRCSVCPRHISPSIIDEISLNMWDNTEIEDYIDNFFERPIPTIWGR